RLGDDRRRRTDRTFRSSVGRCPSSAYWNPPQRLLNEPAGTTGCAPLSMPLLLGGAPLASFWGAVVGGAVAVAVCSVSAGAFACCALLDENRLEKKPVCVCGLAGLVEAALVDPVE